MCSYYLAYKNSLEYLSASPDENISRLIGWIIGISSSVYMTNDEYKFKDMHIAMLQISWTPPKTMDLTVHQYEKCSPTSVAPEIFVELLRQARNEFHELHPQICNKIVASHQPQCNLPENIYLWNYPVCMQILSDMTLQQIHDNWTTTQNTSLQVLRMPRFVFALTFICCWWTNM